MSILLDRINKRLFNLRLKTINSQKGQDYWVINEVFLGMRNGYFLEMGATDGLYGSNTLTLERDYGWDGICVEPSPLYYPALCDNRKCVCVNKCVDEAAREVEFLLAGEIGGIIGNDTDNSYSSRKDKIDSYQKQGKVIRVETVTLENLLEEYDAPERIDYFSLDVEGAETRILRDFNFDKYTFMALTVERPSPDLNRILFKKGYAFVKNVRYDTFYIHESFERFWEIRKRKFRQVAAKRE